MSTRKNDARPSTAYAEPSAKGKYFTKEKQNTCISFFAGVNSARFRDFGKLILALYWERASLHSQRCAVHVAFEHCASVVLLAGCWRKCVCTPSLFHQSMRTVAGLFELQRTGGGMLKLPLRLVKQRLSWLPSSFVFGFLILALVLGDTRPAVAIPAPSLHVRAIPAFARKYGMPCSACHEAWPKLNNFGQTFKDNGYQM